MFDRFPNGLVYHHFQSIRISARCSWRLLSNIDRKVIAKLSNTNRTLTGDFRNIIENAWSIYRTPIEHLSRSIEQIANICQSSIDTQVWVRTPAPWRTKPPLGQHLKHDAKERVDWKICSPRGCCSTTMTHTPFMVGVAGFSGLLRVDPSD